LVYVNQLNDDSGDYRLKEGNFWVISPFVECSNPALGTLRLIIVQEVESGLGSSDKRTESQDKLHYLNSQKLSTSGDYELPQLVFV
jgi:hypothetical protein